MIHQLIKKLQQLKVSINVVNGRLDIQAPKGVLNADMLNEIKNNKEVIIEFINKYKRKTVTASIPKAPEQDRYVLSSSQKRMWILSQFAEANAAYVMPCIQLMEGRLNIPALEKSFHSLLERHEILRSVFLQDEQGEVWQCVKSAADANAAFVLNFHDLRKAIEKETDIERLIDETTKAPFDLSEGSIIKTSVLQIEDNKWVLACVMHHIITDGWSMSVLIRDLIIIYNAYAGNMANPLTPLPIQYKDYATWQQSQLQDGVLLRHKEYWLQQLSGELPVIELPLDKKRPSVKTYNGKWISRTIDKGMTDRLKLLLQERESSLFMGLQAVVNILLYRYTGQWEMITGIPVAGREHYDLEDQVGLYVNTLALRISLQEEDNYLQSLEKVKQVMLAAHQHQSYPFDELVNALGLERNVSRNPLFDVMVALQNADIYDSLRDPQMHDIRICEYKGQAGVNSKFDLTFVFTETAEGLLAGIEYNLDIYEQSTIDRMVMHLQQLLKAVVSQPDQPITLLDYLSAEEKQQLLAAFNNTAFDYPADKTIVGLFEEQVTQTPDHMALIFENTSLSYRELNDRSNRLGHYLRMRYGIGSDDLVGIMLPRSENLIISILGVLKAGAAYLPIDPSYPQERINYMLDDSHCKLLLDEEELNTFLQSAQLYSNENLLPAGTAESLAYVMYTSGSTGRPKGVMIGHRGVIRLVKSPNYVELTDKNVLLSTGSISFDATTFEYWGMLLNGGCLVICATEVLTDSSLLTKVIVRRHVNMMWFTTGWFNELVDADPRIFESLDTILVGGERISNTHINTIRLLYPSLEIKHVYGPTENTTFSLSFPITPEYADIPIGKPISNSTAYVLDERNMLCPVGVVGEICVGGDGLARGYQNQPALTAQKFIANPFSPGQQLYRTGDLGRWLPDGNIDFIGRRDEQVKIRGYRIEPGEIEHVIKQYNGIENAVVLVKSFENTGKILVAYLVAAEKPDVGAVRAYLKKKLPDHMVPSQYVYMQQLPLTSNGKVDKRQLLLQDKILLTNELEYIQPSNETEEKLLSIWSEILGRNKESIGINDNFFDLGGDSLKIIKLSRLIRNIFAKELHLTLLFQYPNIAALAAFIDTFENNAGKENIVQNSLSLLPPVQNSQEIAIIGISCEFPESGDHGKYWDNIRNGRELIKRFTDEELIASGVPESNVNDGTYVRSAGIMNNKAYFDYTFFGYLFEEASLMDPQIRVFHEHAWKALEDAGYTSELENISVGLFCGASENSNWRIYAYQEVKKNAIDPFYLDRISNKDFISTLISYKLNLRGPSFYINTACSTSLTAVHLARQSLLAGECNIALAGGVNINTVKEKGFFYQQDMILSQDGHCRAFDVKANGTAIGEGVGIVVLKRLSDAIRDRDNIYAVIKSSVVNNDGNNKVGYTAPGVDGQAECIFRAHQMAGIHPDSISYVEAHGTGTRLGDPIEVSALNKAFGLTRPEKSCAIGSVKTNMGHTDAAAGVAGLIKVALSLKHKQIPPSLHFTEANPDIDFDKGPFYVNTELREWNRKQNEPLRAGVSSFGIGGTNAHLVLEEAPYQEASSEGRQYKLLTISARNEDALQRYVDDLLDFLHKEPDLNIADLAYTLQVGRKHFAFRKYIVFEDRKDLVDILQAGKTNDSVVNATTKKKVVVFLFSGRGSQYPHMVKDLYEGEFVFRTEMDKGLHILKKLTGNDFKEVIFPVKGESKRIDITIYDETVIFLFDYCFARLIMSWGIFPSCMTGHHVGEYVAACISGVFSFEDALRLLVIHSRLAVPPAAHSQNFDSMVEFYREALKQIQFNEPSIPFISNVTGRIITKEQAGSVDYWFKRMREKAESSDSIDFLLSIHKDVVFIETGVERQLTALLGQYRQNRQPAPVAIHLVRPEREACNDVKYLTARLGELWALNVHIDWALYYSGEERKRISLPPYSFERIKLKTEIALTTGEWQPFAEKNNSDQPQQLKDWIYYPVWKRAVMCEVATKVPAKSYLFFLLPGKFASDVSTGLSCNNNRVVEVRPGEFFLKQSENEYFIDPVEPAHFKMLFDELEKDKVFITDVIYAWGMAVDPSLLQMNDRNREINRTYFSLANIMKQFSAHCRSDERRIVVFTDCLYKVTGNEETGYVQSLMLGLMNSCIQEYSIYCCNIDVNLQEGFSPAGLLKEIETNKKDRVVALRYGNRWLQEYQMHAEALVNEKNLLKNGGIYLITGGLGNVGFVLAEFLIRKYQATIILTGRKRATEPAHNKGARQLFIDRLNYVRSLTDNLLYFNVDVANQEDLENMVNYVEQHTGRINGVIHAAGFTDTNGFEFINECTIGRTLEIFFPKIKGIENIHTIFKERNPDFVWVTSSIASVLGGLGFSAYSSSNLYMDHFLASKSVELPNWKCINLSEMLFDEKEISEEKKSNRTALKPEELALLFEWSVSVKGHPVIMENVSNLNSRINRAYVVYNQLFPETADTVEKIKLKRTGLTGKYVPPASKTERMLADIMEDFFSIEEIGIEDDFFDLGGDSLKAMVLIQRINRTFNTNLILKDLFANRDIKNISAEIDKITFLLQKKERHSKLIV